MADRLTIGIDGRELAGRATGAGDHHEVIDRRDLDRLVADAFDPLVP